MTYLHAHSVSSDDTRYAYAVGRVRALEMRLLGMQRLERLAETKDMEEALRQLSDTVYGVHLDEIEEQGYEAFLRNEEERLLDLVDSLSLDREVSDILRLRYDFHNLKVAIREKISERDLAHLYIDFGRFEAEMLRAAIRTGSIELLPEPLVQAARSADEVYSKSSDISQVDTAVDKLMFAHFSGLADDYGAFYIQVMVRMWIDLANIRTFMRARYLGIESRALPGLLIEGGTIRFTDLYETFPLPIEEVLQRFEFSPYKRIIERGGEGQDKRESFVELEREIDNYMVSFLRLSRYFTFGLEIILAYALLKHSEIRTLRLILAAKDRGLSPDVVKERIADAE